MILSRRLFLTGAAATLIAAPALVRAASLMPVRGYVLAPDSNELITLLNNRMNDAYAEMARNITTYIYSNGDWEPVKFTDFHRHWDHTQISIPISFENSR